MDVQQVTGWLRRLVNFDTRVFEEVRSNPNATIPSVLVAALAILISGIGGLLWWLMRDFGNESDILVHSTLIGSLIAVALWGVVWLGIIYVMLVQLFGERAYAEQLLRVMGFAASPLALMLFMFIPGISFAIGLAALALAFGLTQIAVQYVTTADPGRVLVSNIAGFAAWCAILTLLASGSVSSVKPHAPGVFLFNSTTNVAADVIDATQQLDELLQ
jgi:hypothetical protein